MTGLDNPNLGAGRAYVDMRMVYAALDLELWETSFKVWEMGFWARHQVAFVLLVIKDFRH